MIKSITRSLIILKETKNHDFIKEFFKIIINKNNNNKTTTITKTIITTAMTKITRAIYDVPL